MIPDEAVEAALSAIFAETQALSEFNRGVWTPTIKTILEAAIPYLTERAYNAGHLDGMTGAPNTNPYQSQTDWPDIPRSRK